MLAFQNEDTSIAHEYDLSSEITWSKLRPMLQSPAHQYVYYSHISTWQGQEEDIIEDIVQETARRIFERTQRAKHGLAIPIQSLSCFVIAVIHNYYIDLKRRSLPLGREVIDLVNSFGQDETHPSDMAVEEVDIENVLQLLTLDVYTFPDRQRGMPLIDLMKQIYFSEERQECRLRSRPLSIRILAVLALAQHKHIMGISSQGKSDLLTSLAMQILNWKTSFAFIDPHSDICENILKTLCRVVGEEKLAQLLEMPVTLPHSSHLAFHPYSFQDQSIHKGIKWREMRYGAYYNLCVLSRPEPTYISSTSNLYVVLLSAPLLPCLFQLVMTRTMSRSKKGDSEHYLDFLTWLYIYDIELLVEKGKAPTTPLVFLLLGKVATSYSRISPAPT